MPEHAFGPWLLLKQIEKRVYRSGFCCNMNHRCTSHRSYNSTLSQSEFHQNEVAFRNSLGDLVHLLRTGHERLELSNMARDTTLTLGPYHPAVMVCGGLVRALLKVRWIVIPHN